MNPMPKKLPVRSERYKAFIRQQPCCVCGSYIGVEAAHQTLGKGGKATKAADIQCLPMCGPSYPNQQGCHHIAHSKGEETFWSMVLHLHDTDVNRKEIIMAYLAKKCLEYLNEFISNGGKF